MRIFQLGYPGNMGGANTECWHTVKLWREAGWDVTLIPTWGQDDAMRTKLDAIGADTVHVERVKPENGPSIHPKLADVPGLPGSIIVGMCNRHVFGVIDELRALGCKIVWVNCMTFIDEPEARAWYSHGPADAYVFQSEFQRGKLEPRLRRAGYQPEQGFLIHGAFALDEWPLNPREHVEGTEFVVGRLSRPDADKWSSNHWNIFGAIPYAQRRALCMGWNDQLAAKLGSPPAWAECLEPQSITAQEFMSRCHCLMNINGGARENWPRVGLEAMAAGVPIIAENKWGWQEMIRHGETGFLADNDAEMAYYAAKLAHEEPTRLRMALAGRAHVERLAEPGRLTNEWQALFDFVAAREFKKPNLVI